MAEKVNKQTIKILNELCRRHFSVLMKHLHINYSDRGDYVNAKCPCKAHPGDNDNWTAFSFQYDTGKWACWSHHCEDAYGRDIVGLIRGAKEIPFDEAVVWLQEFIEGHLKMSIDNIDVNTISMSTDGNRQTLFIHKPLPDSLLSYLSDDTSYLIDRGFNVSILEKYGVKYWTRFGTYMHKRIIIPIRDTEGRLVGFSGRDITNKHKAKWLNGRSYVRHNSDDKFHKTSVIMNLNNVMSGEYNSIILVEGPLDGFKLEMSGIENWGACLGSTVSPMQQHLLLQAGIKRLILAFDSDDAGQTCTRKAADLMRSNFDIKVIDVPKPYDIGALAPNTIRSLMKI
jgi:5S rRNA maturation endonuclease (ribonuclease M5)